MIQREREREREYSKKRLPTTTRRLESTLINKEPDGKRNERTNQLTKERGPIISDLL